MCDIDENDRKPDRNPNPLSAIANLRRTGLPWRQVLALMATNNWRKIRALQNCCGNLAAPGC